MNNDNSKTKLSNTQKPVIVNKLSKKNDSISISSLVFGIMSCILFFSIMYSIIVGIIGLILGIISIAQKRDGFKLAIAGIISSVIGLLIGTLFFIVYILFTIWYFNKSLIIWIKKWLRHALYVKYKP